MSFLMEYPTIGSPTETVTLRNPQFEDQQKTEAAAIIGRSDFGQAQTRHVTGRNVWQVWEYTFLVYDDPEPLREFLAATTGLEIKVTDHDANVRNGFIIMEPIQFVELRSGVLWEVTFTFMESQ